MKRSLDKLIYLPLGAFLMVFAVMPAIGMLFGSFQRDNGFTFSNYENSLQGQYLHAFLTTARLACMSSLIGILFGVFIVWGTVRMKQVWVQKMVTSMSSIMANFAGLPLAVAFMVTMGTSGVLTVFVSKMLHLSIIDLGWNLASFSGLLVIYASFQIPLAIVLLLPTFSSLHKDWEEAVYSLGANIGTYVRRVVLPIVFPSVIGTFSLLFANAFSAYVTAYAIAGGTVNLLPIQIGYLIDGNLTLDVGLGDALAMEEMIVLGTSVLLFFVTQRMRIQGRTWRRQSQ